jgi:hypothetical protein
LATPYETFTKTMGRVDGLLVLQPALHGIRGRPAQHVSDVLRGALVLAVGALDALVLESVLEAVPAAARGGRLGDTVAKWVRDEPEAFLAALGEADPIQEVAVLCRAQLGALTFQRSVTIEGVMRDVLGCGPPWNRAAEILTVEGDEWDAERVKDELDEFVKRRHRIAHSGDVRPGSTGTQPIQRPYVERAARLIEAVGDTPSSGSTSLCPRLRLRK